MVVSEQANRVFQSRDITVVLIVLLSVTVSCVIVSLWGVPGKPNVARSPSSIAAQAFLLAGSQSVNLRDGVYSVKNSKIWEEGVSSLG